jgi:PKD repeat protein
MKKSRGWVSAVLVAFLLAIGPASIASTTSPADSTASTVADPTTTTQAVSTATTVADPTPTTEAELTTTTQAGQAPSTESDQTTTTQEAPIQPEGESAAAATVAPGTKAGPTDQADPLTLSAEGGESVTTAVAIAVAEDLPTGFVEEVVLSGFSLPTMVRFASDGRVFVVEKRGMVLAFDSLSDSTPKTVINLTGSTYAWADRGMHGMALDPAFPSQPYIYLLYATDPIGYGDSCPNPPGGTTDGCVANARLSRIQVNANNDVVGSEQTLLNGFWCQQYPSHSIGDLAFGADGALYVSAGDGASFTFADYGQGGGTQGNPPPTPENPCGDPPVPVGGDQQPPTAEGGALRSQDLRTSGDPVTFDGAILRVDKNTGAAFPGNPLLGGDPQDDRIVAIGQRNPFRITTRPGTSEVWTADVGWNLWEEINRVSNPAAGLTNLGWPCYEGANRNSSYDNLNLNICESFYSQGGHTGPYFSYRHGLPVDGCDGQASSASAIVFYEGGNYPSEYDNSLFFADYTRQCMWVMFRGANGLPNPANILLFATATPSVGLEVGPNGDIFSVDHSAGTIVRYRFTGSGNNPPTAVASANPTSGTAPLTVNFNGSGSSDPDQDPLTYAWDLDGDGQFDDSTLVNPSFTYTAAATYVATLRVDDGNGGTDVDSVTIDVTGGGGGGVGFVDLPGTAGNYISAPDHSRLDVTGDLDLRADVALDDWQTNNAKLVSKMGGAYELMLDKSTGGLRLAFRDSANQLKIRNSTASLPVADGARLQVRGSLDVDNGAGGHTVTFYYRTNTTLGLSDNSGWTQLGSPITFAGTTTIKTDGTSLALGSSPGGGSSFWSGSYYQAQILNGTTVAANPDFRTTGQLISTPPNYSQWRDSPGNNYTINGTAWSYNPG